jgi:hypothetical protein
MVRAKAVLDRGGCLHRFSASGHAGSGSRGYDIVCASVSVLARTAYRAFEGLSGIELRGEAAEPGFLSFEIRGEADSPERAAGMAAFFVTGMSDLARDYPEAVEFTIERDWEE